MPKKKSNLSKKSRQAYRADLNRKQESALEREDRLNKLRLYTKTKRGQESDEEKEATYKDPYTLKQKVLKLIFQLESAPLNEFEKNLARIEFFKQAYIGLQKLIEAAGDLGSAPAKQNEPFQEKEQNKIPETQLQHNKQWPYQRQQQLHCQKQYKQQKQDEQPKEHIGSSNSSYSRAELMGLSSCSFVNFEDEIFASSQEKEHTNKNDENEKNKNEVVITDETDSDD